MNSSEGSNTGFVRTAASNLSALKSINHNRRLLCDSIGADDQLDVHLVESIAYSDCSTTIMSALSCCIQARLIAYVFTVHT
jgi:hypothetical protein